MVAAPQGRRPLAAKTRAASRVIVAPMTARTRAILGIAVAVVAVGVLVAGYVGFFMRSPREVAAVARPGRPAEITLQTVGALGPRYNRSTWVSYLARDDDGDWEHTTHLKVPANSLVRVTIHQYDSATGLRNPFFARPQGTGGGVMQLDGKPVDVIDPNLTSHTFAIPQLGVFVPLPGVADNAPNQCSAAPCTEEQAHRTITFTFRTGKKGRYRWQCFVPCAAGFVAGFGGPMQSFGYMDGYLDVV
jgi:hypothetical protein